MEPSQETVCISSFNSTGFGIGVQNFITTLSIFSNILCIQEHFLLDGKMKNHSNTNKIRKLLNHKYDMFIVPAYKENNQVSRGRGKGGLATLWDKRLTKYVSQVKCSNFRLQVTRFDFPSGSLLLLNTYFPCDPRVHNFNEEELLTLLTEIRLIMSTQACIYNLVLGDLNSHFARNTHFTTMIETFFNDINFHIFWEHPDQTDGHLINAVDYTYQQFNNGKCYTSIIDHFVGNTSVLNSVTEAGVIHTGENPSNHSPIFAKLEIGFIDGSTESVKNEKRVSWKKSSAEAHEHFLNTLANKLEHLDVPDCINCRDVHCTIHMEQIESYTMDLLETLESAAEECLHCTGGGKTDQVRQNATPGWTEYVKPFSEESKFWCAVWGSAGRPQQGDLYNAMMYSKRQYKYAIRRLKRANEKIQNDKFVQGILSGGVNIFNEIKKFRGKSNNCSSRIDDQVGAKNISNKFADIYSQLYNQHEQETDLGNLENDIHEAIGELSLVDVDRITVNLVEKALKKMKDGKNDSIFNIQSDCMTNGPNALNLHITNLLKTFVVHGAVPYFVLVCTLLPLVKDNLADTTSSQNYRAIASGSLLLKLLDIVILLLEGEKLQCDQLQFGFQAGASTSMCSWTATTVIEHYNRNGTTVYGCAMDLSKAFDLVEWVSLFKLLKEKGISSIFLRILLCVYRNQTCDVKWNSSYSYRFSVTNGVRQGAVSSPLLFSIYIDGLISLLRNSGLGCRVDTFFYGVLGYADDLLLLSASRSGLQAMVTICEEFAKLRKLKFSTDVDPIKSKTKCIIFTKVKNARENVAQILLNGDPLPWVDEVKHLGNILEYNNSMQRDCLVKRGKFIGKVNSLFQEFTYVDPPVMMKLLSTYVTSFYGSNLWDLYSAQVTRIFSSWNVTVRNVFNLPWDTHRYLVEAVSESTHPKTMMCSRFMKFMESMAMCKKSSVRYLAASVRDDRRTVAGRTVSKIAVDCKAERRNLTSKTAKSLKYWTPPLEQQWRISMLKELLAVRAGAAVIHEVEHDEVQMMIDHLCSG